MNNSRKKLLVRMDSAAPCKARQTSDERSRDQKGQGEILRTGNTKKWKTLHACIIEAHESISKRVKEI